MFADQPSKASPQKKPIVPSDRADQANTANRPSPGVGVACGVARAAGKSILRDDCWRRRPADLVRPVLAGLECGIRAPWPASTRNLAPSSGSVSFFASRPVGGGRGRHAAVALRFPSRHSAAVAGRPATLSTWCPARPVRRDERRRCPRKARAPCAHGWQPLPRKSHPATRNNGQK